MPEYTFYYNRSGTFGKQSNEFTVQITALTRHTTIDAADLYDLYNKIHGISGPAWSTITKENVVETKIDKDKPQDYGDKDLVYRAPYYGDVVQLDDSYFVLDTNGVFEPVTIVKEDIPENVVDKKSVFSNFPGGTIPPSDQMNNVAKEQGLVESTPDGKTPVPGFQPLKGKK